MHSFNRTQSRPILVKPRESTERMARTERRRQVPRQRQKLIIAPPAHSDLEGHCQSCVQYINYPTESAARLDSISRSVGCCWSRWTGLRGLPALVGAKLDVVPAALPRLAPYHYIFALGTVLELLILAAVQHPLPGAVKLLPLPCGLDQRVLVHVADITLCFVLPRLPPLAPCHTGKRSPSRRARDCGLRERTPHLHARGRHQEHPAEASQETGRSLSQRQRRQDGPRDRCGSPAAIAPRRGQQAWDDGGVVSSASRQAFPSGPALAWVSPARAAS